MRDLWWTARGQDVGLLATTRTQAQAILAPIAAHITTLLAPFGITAPVFGIRGSLAAGYSWDSLQGSGGGDGKPWDGSYFDVDAFVKCTNLSSIIAPGAGGISLWRLSQAVGFRPGEAGNAAAMLVRAQLATADNALRSAFGSRLKPETFWFKVFSSTSGVTGLTL